MSSAQSNSINDTSVKDTSWWQTFVDEAYPNDLCIKYLRCSRKTYLFLVKFLNPYIAPRIGSLDKHNIRKGVNVEKQVAVLLYKLTSCADYIVLSQIFKIHKTTIHKILYRAIITLNKYLLYDAINMPKEEEAQFIAEDFEQTHKLPQIIGVMSIVHIPIASPINLNYQFLNSRLYPSFILQSVVDSNYSFRDISVRHAGAVEPHLILEESNIYKYSEKVLPSTKRNINGVDVSYKIIGPAKGPICSWLLNDYNPPQTSEEILFNKRLEDMRSFADTVILRLRSRFLILSQFMDLNYKVSPQIIAACCILHNVCEKNEDPFLDEWLITGREHIRKFPQPEMKGKWKQPDKETLIERNVLKDYTSELIIQPTRDILEVALTNALLDPI